MEADTANRYRSRILREMNANRANPFNSPPSSTGSHGTVSPTMSSVFSDPDGESTRRLNDDIARVTAPRKLPVNWEAAHRKWPEFFSLPAKGRDAPIFVADDTDTRPLSSKENKPPLNSVRFTDDSTQDAWPGSTKTRGQMQPRVDNESDLSIPSKSPAGALSHRVAAKSARHPSPLTKVQMRRPSDPISQPQRQPSISDALDRLRRASLSPQNGGQRDRQRESNSPPLSSAKSSMTAVPPSPNSMGSPGQDASHVRSFFMPDVSHLGDFVTGTLKFSGSMRNGVPIFVKHGRVHDRQERPSAAAHAEVDGIEVPQDEEKIFVSMDMIRDEIVSLQEHHDKVQEYAENLQQQVERLELQLRSRKYTAGVGHDSDEKLVSRKNQLEIEVATLQARLDQALHKINTNEVENVSLAHERDRAVSRLQSACDDISKLTRKLSVKEKELESSHKKLETTDQMRHDNHTLRRDLVSLKHGRDALELENTSLRAENDNLRKEQKDLREEIESLRSDNNNIRRGDDSLINENRSLRSSNKTLMEENEDLRENLDAAQHEHDAAREEVDTLRQQVETMSQERTTFQEDNESLVRHNEKYFSENKILRRENSGFERSIHDLHAENMKLKEEIDFLKQQLDHCRPVPKEDFSARRDEETDDNMTSAFFVPDITINTNESGPAEATETREMPEMPALPELTSQSYKTPTGRNDTEQETRDTTKHETLQKSKSKSKTTSTKQAAQGQRVAFSIPEKSTQSDKNVANKGSKRRNRADSAQQSYKGHGADPFHDLDDTTGLQSVDNTTQDQAISLNLSVKDQRQSRQRDWTNTSQKPQQAPRHSQKLVVETGVAMEASKRLDKDACPALSSDARRILDGLCAHSCRNCVVCSRITSHRGVVSSAELASGKKRVTVPRPVPITDRDLTAEDPTMRPSQSPGHALALVIKGLEDEAHHLQLELSRLQAQYNGSDKGLGRRDRLNLAEGIRMLLKRLEVKNDQIYSLYDVLEGQKAAGQAMTEEEVEMTVLNITGMTVRDVTGGSESFTWEGIQDAA
ncbi:Spindle pole body protein ppc89 [Tolypocladium ophioglossoides CBS 100239]|uniref:Spindle pole body protein ppc89 n=1 Tax=Tolypocladium ophioglossoides (strain CBS 100239) TaxID=1163406 RepID=A0A0L0N9U6_TOLOC|nr:Spindle pole body protein ppc89 [Tolypocladium ophioglossoides CBS 100239]